MSSTTLHATPSGAFGDEYLRLVDGIWVVQEVFSTLEKHDDVIALRRGLRDLAVPCSQKEAEDLLDCTRAGKISKNEFLLFCLLKEFQLKQVFDRLDANEDGRLTKDEFMQGMREMGWGIPESQLKHHFQQSDLTASDDLTYREFRWLVRHHLKDFIFVLDQFHSQNMHCYDVGGFNLQPRRERDLSVADGLMNLLAGFVAGSFSRTLTAPAERVKTELQVAEGNPPGVTKLARHLYKEGGVRAFFQGNLANCLKVAPQSGLFFVLIEVFKKNLPTKGNPHFAALHSFVAGSLAGMSSQFIIYPLEPIKTVLTVDSKGQYSGIIDAGRQLFQQRGIAGLYGGVLPTIAGCIPYAGFQFLTYEGLLRAYVRSQNGDRSPPFHLTFLSALFSSCVGMTVSYPMMVVRTRLQVQGTSPDKPLQYSGMLHCFRKTYQTEGCRGFMRGIGPNLAKAAPAAAINLAVYEKAKHVIKALQAKR